jgi:multimeric flavodoxin WrbA
MKLIAINGSPRKSCNTGTLLKKAIEGAQAVGAETELRPGLSSRVDCGRR